ncbi:3-oxoacyl-[acyl-carrier-protein] reductase FabG-like [Zerene cesonia]|uniref:3-oxoacyl-[acyl-carrier-protein] reductase FabG-like n=1 Tax=Zerene cesonia TaxID=33412 RepID=UPI0018E50F3B|nr:3-oxoacyl-[acyl-carrier-protein] reductase FabG-like [Zerene cesonia]
MSFLNKVVIVTGASSGIGAATSILFAKEGAKVAMVGRNEEKLKKVAQKCPTKPLVIKADISNDNEVRSLIKDTIDTFGNLDVLVNNAGIGRYASILDENLMNCYDEIMRTNLRAQVYATHLAVPYLIKSGGNIVNVSSSGGSSLPAIPCILSYLISKAGVDHFTRAAALELAPTGVRVNSVSPGPVRTDMMENSGVKASWDDAIPLTVLNKVAEPEEIAELIMYLASEKAKSITGSNYVCDNGAKLKC